MRVLEGLLFINGIDVCREYGVFLTEAKEGEFSNYEELLRPSNAKPTVAVDYTDDNGERQPDLKEGVKLEARDLTLYFAIVGNTKAEYVAHHKAFFTLLRTGDKGWLTMQLPELERTFRLRYVALTDFEQLTPLADGSIGSRFRVKFREPQPQY